MCEEELSVSRGSVSLSNRLAHWTSQTLSSRHSKLPKMGMGSSWRKRPGVSRSLYEGTLHFRPDWYRRRTGDYVSKINFEFHVLNVEAFGLINRILELGLTVRYFIYIFLILKFCNIHQFILGTASLSYQAIHVSSPYLTSSPSGPSPQSRVSC